ARGADALRARAEAAGGPAAEHPPQPPGAGAEAPALRARRRAARVVRAAADLVLEGRALPHLRCLQVVAARPRLADAVRARVHLDGALQPGARRDHLAVRVSGRCEEQRAEHRTTDDVHVSLPFGLSGETSTRNATESSGGHGGCARERRLSGQRVLRSRRHLETDRVEKLPAPPARGTYSCAPRRGPFLDDVAGTPLHGRSAAHRMPAEQGDAMHARRELRFGLGIVTALASALLAPAAAHATPTAITFSIEHADCDGAGVNSFALYLNDTLLATLPSTEDCMCNDSPLIATFTDAATLALFDPAACNRFRVNANDGWDVALGFVRVTVSGGGTSASTCLFDGFP